MYNNETLNYDPMVHGAINAMRIWNKDGYEPWAELAFAYGGSVQCEWDLISNQEKYASGINSYTIIYDERIAQFGDFQSWIKSLDQASINSH